MTKVKLWISDIDGTIINYDRTFTPEMKELILKINNSENKLVLATGRMFMGAYHEAKKFNLKTPLICYQGAVVRTKDEILWQSPVGDEIVWDIIEYLNRPDTSIDDCVEEGISAYSYDVGYILGSYINNSDNDIEMLNLFLKYKDNGINKPFTIGEEIIKETLGNNTLGI